MNSELLITIAHEGLYLLILVAAPALTASLLFGFFVSILQTATQIQEQTISFTARAFAVIAALLLSGKWIGVQLIQFTESIFRLIQQISK